MIKTGFDILLADLRELTETNCHGEALEMVSAFFGNARLRKAFEAINVLHITVGYLDSPLSELRHNFTEELFNYIKAKHGEETANLIKDCL